MPHQGRLQRGTANFTEASEKFELCMNWSNSGIGILGCTSRYQKLVFVSGFEQDDRAALQAWILSGKEMGFKTETTKHSRACQAVQGGKYFHSLLCCNESVHSLGLLVKYLLRFC